MFLLLLLPDVADIATARACFQGSLVATIFFFLDFPTCIPVPFRLYARVYLIGKTTCPTPVQFSASVISSPHGGDRLFRLPALCFSEVV
jgi:hypothetical protein